LSGYSSNRRTLTELLNNLTKNNLTPGTPSGINTLGIRYGRTT
jgi:hypothetical protein